MTDDLMSGLIELYVSEELPDALRTLVEAHLAAHPADSADVDSLRATVALLVNAPKARLDRWFADRLLDRVLQDYSHDNTLQQTAAI